MQIFHPRASVAEIYERLSPFVSSKFIPKRDQDLILRYASSLPSFFTPHVFCYEFPLNQKKKWADFAFELFLSEEYLQQFQNLSMAKTSWQWQNISLFFQKGIERKFFPPNLPPPQDLGERDKISDPIIQSLWMEFDVGSSLYRPPEPNVMISLSGKHPDFFELTEEIFYLLLGKKLPTSYSNLLRKCNTQGFRVRSLGLMLARPGDPLYLYLENPSIISPTAFSSYLKSIEYPDLIPCVDLYKKLQSHLRCVHFHIGIQDRVLPRFNLICKCDQKNTILQKLISEKMILERDRDELLRWIGEQIEPLGDLRKSPFAQSSIDHVIARRIGHIKLTLLPQKPLQIKAYIGGHIWSLAP